MVKLGEQYADRFTGFEGIAVARSEYLYGCVRVGLEGKAKVGDVLWFDEQRLVAVSSAKVGGPMSSPPSRDPR